MEKDKRNKEIDKYLSDPRAKSEVLLESMAEGTDKGRDELLWEAVQKLWMTLD